jgi:protein-S-isoprenylcysteine O-methyltransferase Ste14
VSVAVLQIMATAASVLFCGLLVVMLLVRTVPRARASGMLPRLLAVIGTFLGTGFLYLKPVPLPLPLGIAMIVVLVVTAAAEIYVLTWLGRSFAIMAEARTLVTGGPYRFVRHPLYVAETIGMAAVMAQFFGVSAVALSLAYVAAQVGRALCEEKVLAATFPDYAAYAARTARFIPFVY